MVRKDFPRTPKEIPPEERGKAFSELIVGRLKARGKDAVTAADGNPGHKPYSGMMAACKSALEGPDMANYLGSHGIDPIRRDVAGYFQHMGIKTSSEEDQKIDRLKIRTEEGVLIERKKGKLIQANIIPGVGVTNLYDAIMKKLKKEAKQKYPGKTPVFLMTSPTFGLYALHPDHNKFEIATVPLRPEKNWHLQPDDLKDIIETIEASGKKKVVVFYNINPHNPTGAVLGEKEIKKLAKVMKDHDVFVIDDMIYHGLEYDGKQAYPFAAVDGMFDRSITLLGLSKAFCAPSLRAAVACGRMEDIEYIASEMHRVNHSVPLISQVALQEAFSMDPEKAQKRQAYFEEQRTEYQFKARLMMALLQGQKSVRFLAGEHEKALAITEAVVGDRKAAEMMLDEGLPGVKVMNYPPEGGYYFCVDFSDHRGKYFGRERIDNSNVLAAVMIAAGKTSGVPSGYMLAEDDFPMMMRFSFAANPSRSLKPGPENIVRIALGVKKVLEAMTNEPGQDIAFSLGNANVPDCVITRK